MKPKVCANYGSRPRAGQNITVEDQVAEGDKVTTRFTFSGTQRGKFAGIPPTGRRVTVTALNIYHIKGASPYDSAAHR